MTFVDWLGNYNLSPGEQHRPHHWWPGNCHEAHAWACKVGIQTAIDDIQNNHPNDFVGMTFFSSPKYSQRRRRATTTGRRAAGPATTSS